MKFCLILDLGTYQLIYAIHKITYFSPFALSDPTKEDRIEGPPLVHYGTFFLRKLQSANESLVPSTDCTMPPIGNFR